MEENLLQYLCIVQQEHCRLFHAAWPTCLFLTQETRKVPSLELFNPQLLCQDRQQSYQLSHHKKRVNNHPAEAGIKPSTLFTYLFIAIRWQQFWVATELNVSSAQFLRKKKTLVTMMSQGLTRSLFHDIIQSSDGSHIQTYQILLLLQYPDPSH